ncbi:MAG: Tol-Pal system beta propeller repeat protein TolB, partial [Deltaproteobacteria bacterium]|nr:Tol-Pal system beta propeller repeat protein TolB [Deltaproteobacteria bacterium]
MNKTNLLCCLLLLFFAPYAAAVKIEINSPGEQTIPLALTRFLPLADVNDKTAAQIDQVLMADLELSGLFELANPVAFLSDAQKLGLSSTQVDFAQWRLLGVDAVVKGGYRLDGDKLTIEARLYDAVTRR